LTEKKASPNSVGLINLPAGRQVGFPLRLLIETNYDKGFAEHGTSLNRRAVS
jgi:hypothetical protein